METFSTSIHPDVRQDGKRARTGSEPRTDVELRPAGSSTWADFMGAASGGEEAVHESEQRYRATFYQAAVGLALTSPSGAWLRANRKLYEILGYPMGSLRKHSVPGLLHPDDRAPALERWRRVLSRAVESDVLELRLRRADGSYVWTKVTLSSARCNRGSYRWVVAAVEDIQERKRLEEEAQRAQEFEDQLYGMIGHDIRSPLAALKATVAALRAHSEGLSAAQLRALDRISRSTERIHRLVQEMLDYTGVRLGDGVSIQPRPTDAHALCEQVAEEFEHSHPGRVTLCATQVDGRAQWDPERMKELLTNLVENAITYGAHDRPAWILLSGNERELILQVHNDGEPIPPERLPRLFEPFNYGPGVEQTVKLSLGLGLYIVREVVQAHGGTISVRSTRQDGTTFVVRLPRNPGPPPRVEAH